MNLTKLVPPLHHLETLVHRGDRCGSQIVKVNSKLILVIVKLISATVLVPSTLTLADALNVNLKLMVNMNLNFGGKDARPVFTISFKFPFSGMLNMRAEMETLRKILL
eukprot:Pompholyxophrys_sp_v1_NODE_194_length_1242_cov_99.133951.p3 type:complete len:108 gc:universal NODE_194_length_1242_cov_99.133951:1214-891(-)